MDLADFCEAEYPRLVGALGLWCGDRAVAEELAQETLARVWQRWPRVRNLENPRAWAHRVALNLARSQWRRAAAERRARERLSEVERDQAGEANAAEGVALKEAITALPKRKRSALILHYYLDLPFKEVADVMQIPESTAKSLSRRAVQDLRRALGESETEEAWDAT